MSGHECDQSAVAHKVGMGLEGAYSCEALSSRAGLTLTFTSDGLARGFSGSPGLDVPLSPAWAQALAEDAGQAGPEGAVPRPSAAFSCCLQQRCAGCGPKGLGYRCRAMDAAISLASATFVTLVRAQGSSRWCRCAADTSASAHTTTSASTFASSPTHVRADRRAAAWVLSQAWRVHLRTEALGRPSAAPMRALPRATSQMASDVSQVCLGSNPTMQLAWRALTGTVCRVLVQEATVPRECASGARRRLSSRLTSLECPPNSGWRTRGRCRAPRARR